MTGNKKPPLQGGGFVRPAIPITQPETQTLFIWESKSHNLFHRFRRHVPFSPNLCKNDTSFRFFSTYSGSDYTLQGVHVGKSVWRLESPITQPVPFWYGFFLFPICWVAVLDSREEFPLGTIRNFRWNTELFGLFPADLPPRHTTRDIVVVLNSDASTGRCGTHHPSPIPGTLLTEAVAEPDAALVLATHQIACATECFVLTVLVEASCCSLLSDRLPIE